MGPNELKGNTVLKFVFLVINLGPKTVINIAKLNDYMYVLNLFFPPVVKNLPKK